MANDDKTGSDNNPDKIDAATREAIEGLKKTFGVSTDGEVIRRALKMAQEASIYDPKP